VGSDVVLLKRLRRLEGEPLMTSTTWLPADLCPGLETADVSNRSLHELSAEHHHTIVRGTRTLEAVLADQALAALLETRKGNPLVRLEILSYVASGRALEYSVAYHRGDRARFEFDVANTQSAPEEMA
jgi:GntR family transcriptional regulator, N-acetylglucosamine utilization regulator